MVTNGQGYFSGLRCRVCGKAFSAGVQFVCDHDFGPLEVDYDYDRIGRSISREAIERRGPNMWRYRELLPIDHDVTVAPAVGYTPLIRADRLARWLGIREVWVKNDTVNYPTLSFKDRVVSVALSRAKEFGYGVVGCASTGNLANSVAANAAAAGMAAYVLIPADLEGEKVLGSLVYGAHVVGVDGTYDQVNRLCSEIAGRYGWAIVNVNLRPYYAEGSKTLGLEVAEQLGWRLPDEVVVPMAGGSLICKVAKAFDELVKLGLVEPRDTRIHGSQAAGCSPIVDFVKRGSGRMRPVKHPDTVAKSLAIGDPADGYFAADTIHERDGAAENPTDEETIEGIKKLAECEGIFAETAGGVTVAAAKRLAEQGRLDRDSSVVLCVTGHGLKTKEAIVNTYRPVDTIKPSLNDFDALVQRQRTEKAEEAPCP